MTDTDSSTLVEDPLAVVAKRDSKKKKKKKHKKKRNRDDAPQDTEEDTHIKITTDQSDGAHHEHEKKRMKKSKKKKDKKRKRKDDNIGGDDDHQEMNDKIASSSAIGDNIGGNDDDHQEMDDKIASSSAIEYYPDEAKPKVGVGGGGNNDGGDTTTNNITLLLFYQYVEPPWDDTQFQTALKYVTHQGEKNNITGRMRVAREGLNCTLTGSYDGIRNWCAALRKFDGGRSKIDPVTGEKITEFANTEFKLTDDLPPKQRFPKLHPFEVVELVNYGLAGSRAPPISKHGGTHLEPSDYHKKMCEKDTVIIDVRNHYEANIGRFAPPKEGAQMIDPKMRKSTEFPMWLDKPETKEMLRGKQVLMYCTGGVRCEMASALLKQKIDNEEDTKALNIKGVYQLQGGVDKYFKDFPTGGLWKGKNYTFDKRFAHAPPQLEAVERTKKIWGDEKGNAADEILGKCEACLKPWDMYRGKRRCPTCGVPSLICRECFEADKAGTKKLGKEVRCDLCVEESVRNKRELREREEREMKEYEDKLRSKLDTEYEPPIQRKRAITRKPKPNPERITRLFLKNMCAKQMDEAKLLETLHPAKVTHIQWLTDRNTGKFYGSAFIEVKTAEDAGSVLALDGTVVLGRRIKTKCQKANEKDVWPIKNTEVSTAY